MGEQCFLSVAPHILPELQRRGLSSSLWLTLTRSACEEPRGAEVSGALGWFTLPTVAFSLLWILFSTLLMVPLSSIRQCVVSLHENFSLFFAIWNVVNLLIFSRAVSFYLVLLFYGFLVTTNKPAAVLFLLSLQYHLCRINVGLPGFWQAFEFWY